MKTFFNRTVGKGHYRLAFMTCLILVVYVVYKQSGSTSYRTEMFYSWTNYNLSVCIDCRQKQPNKAWKISYMFVNGTLRPNLKRADKGPRCGVHSGILYMQDSYGRTGNKMYQYAALYGLSKHFNRTPVLEGPIISYLNTTFALTHPFFKVKRTPPNTSYRVYDVRQCGYDRTVIDRIDNHGQCNISLQGFFQSWCYFYFSIDELISSLALVAQVQFAAETKLQNVSLRAKSSKYFDKWKPLTFIGVHVRRGDYNYPHMHDFGYLKAPLPYYHLVFKYYTQRYHNPIFVVLSNDKEWCRKTFAKFGEIYNAFIEISDSADARTDLAILSLCNHTAMSVGTFGWWGSVLSQGETLYYSGESVKGSDYSNKLSSHKSDFYLPYWVAPI